MRTCHMVWDFQYQLELLTFYQLEKYFIEMLKKKVAQKSLESYPFRQIRFIPITRHPQNWTVNILKWMQNWV